MIVATAFRHSDGAATSEYEFGSQAGVTDADFKTVEERNETKPECRNSNREEGHCNDEDRGPASGEAVSDH